MPTVTQHVPGTFSWFELATTDIAAGRAFYMALFGWTMREDPTGVAPYTMFRSGAHDVAAGYTLIPQQREAGVPPHWLNYVTVENADDAATRAAAHGGKVVMGPMDVMDHGRMAVLQDPQGATFAVWQPRKTIGVTLVGEPNLHCWSELATRDAAAAERFYTAVLPWTAKTEMMGPVPYTQFMRGDRPAGGMMAMDAQWGDVPPHWTIYFSVADCDAMVAKATSLGGKVVVPPFEAGDVGRCAVLLDPQGAAFSIIRMKG
jgi:predicted enzyme related to lactoylglutathione lyase